MHRDHDHVGSARKLEGNRESKQPNPIPHYINLNQVMSLKKYEPIKYIILQYKATSNPCPNTTYLPVISKKEKCRKRYAMKERQEKVERV